MLLQNRSSPPQYLMLFKKALVKRIRETTCLRGTYQVVKNLKGRQLWWMCIQCMQVPTPTSLNITVQTQSSWSSHYGSPIWWSLMEIHALSTFARWNRSTIGHTYMRTFDKCPIKKLFVADNGASIIKIWARLSCLESSPSIFPQN